MRLDDSEILVGLIQGRQINESLLTSYEDSCRNSQSNSTEVSCTKTRTSIHDE